MTLTAIDPPLYSTDMPDPAFRTVTEADASTAVSAIYREIKATMGVALVNLIWRHLATEPAVLQWAWQALQPHYASSAIPQFARQLRTATDPPALDRLGEHELNVVKRKPNDPTVIDAVLHTYERGNAQNLIAMCYLQQWLAGAPQRPISALHTNRLAQVDEQADRAATTIPPLPDPNTLDSAQQDQIEEMTKCWVPTPYRGITPSVYRHLALWPEVLTIFHHRLCRTDGMNEALLYNATQQAITHAYTLAQGLHESQPPTEDLTNAESKWLAATLDRFINGMIAPGVIIVPAMRAILPVAGDGCS